MCRVEQDAGDRAAGLRRLRWASAGHPDPMLLGADGSVVDLAAPVGPPLGIGWLGPRVDGLVSMPEGSTLLLFTDGLFERRGVPLDEGRAQVREIVERSAGLPLTLLCDRLLEELLGDGRRGRRRGPRRPRAPGARRAARGGRPGAGPARALPLPA